ncbi:MAG TPA: hypothetical protein IGS40_06990 [Trichormus sp. M33_DOE_039]|nr:hypothetical protein [Trichormus sp. M33_DOE_039]
MTTFPGAPRLLKGAIVALDEEQPNPIVIPFQYNPGTVNRTLELQAAGEEGDTTEALRLKGAPVESIKLEIELDATDDLETGQSNAVQMGIYPRLSALEILLYPPSNLIVLNERLLSLGTIQITPPIAPLTLLIWGERRVVPVRINEFSITEEAHDVNLNPIRAKISLGLRVLSYNDLSANNRGYHLFLSHQIIKETMANLGRVNNLDAVTGSNLNLL